MATYQLRLPASYTLSDWLDEITQRVWEALKRHEEFQSLSFCAYVLIWKLLREILERDVTTYRSCGLWSYCHAGLAPSPWMPPSDFHPDDLQARCYILETAGGLEELVQETADRLGEWLGCFSEGTPPRSVFEADLEAALRLGWAKYLYENPNCGTSPFCQGRIPVNPWQLLEEERTP